MVVSSKTEIVAVWDFGALPGAKPVPASAFPGVLVICEADWVGGEPLQKLCRGGEKIKGAERSVEIPNGSDLVGNVVLTGMSASRR